MAKKYFTLTGTKHYYGSNFLKPGMKVQLEKEPDNEFDPEAILVKLNGLGTVSYTHLRAHETYSPYTIVGESMSAGRLYDKIKDTAKGKVVLVTERGILCKLCKEKKTEQEWMADPDCLSFT